MSTANRGKGAEDSVRKVLIKLEAAFAAFTFNRVMDSHAAGGRLPASPGDFQAFSATGGVSKNFVIEVKEFAHDFRLSYNNFDLAKVARMHKRKLAGSVCFVLLYSTTAKSWKYADLSFFQARDTSVGSWDLREIPAIDLYTFLKDLLCQQDSQTLL